MKVAHSGNGISKFRKILCNVFGWHKPKDSVTFDGCNFLSVCKYCGKEIMQDSQGNWF